MMKLYKINCKTFKEKYIIEVKKPHFIGSMYMNSKSQIEMTVYYYWWTP